MPAIINHEARRLALAELAADLIAAEGIDAATVRAVAKAAGFSTKVVSHYFEDKRHLMLETYRFAARSSAEQAKASQPADKADAAAYAASLCPISPVMIRNWKVWFAFWGFAISDAHFAREQARHMSAVETRLGHILGKDARFETLGEAERQARASDVMVTVFGVALKAVFDIERWPPARQRMAVVQRLTQGV